MNKTVYNEYLNSICKIPRFLNKYLEVPCLVRLKNIGYFCGMDYASKEVYDFREKITRFDHSLTVALLTWKFTHDKKATIAGLFHDVATPCFAHVIDYMNKDYANQEFPVWRNRISGVSGAPGLRFDPQPRITG